MWFLVCNLIWRFTCVIQLTSDLPTCGTLMLMFWNQVRRLTCKNVALKIFLWAFCDTANWQLKEQLSVIVKPPESVLFFVSTQWEVTWLIVGISAVVGCLYVSCSHKPLRVTLHYVSVIYRPVWVRGHCKINPPRFLPSVVRGDWTRVVLFCCILGCLLRLICI